MVLGEEQLALIEEAEQRGYLEFNEGRTRITYICGRRYSDDYTDPEERVRAYVFSWLVIRRGYPGHRIEIEFTVPRRTRGDKADVVVFSDDSRGEPYLVVEAKSPGCGVRDWAQAIEQGFGNANGLRTTRYLLVDRGVESVLFDIQNFGPTERIQNRLGDREALAENYGIARQFRLIAGETSDIRAVGPRILETAVRRAHAAIWAGGKRDPLTAFDEWSKLLFAKIWDERHTPNGEPRHFQVAGSESVSQVGGRIRQRFAEARRGDTSVFGDERIRLPDDKIVEVVQIVQDIGFVLCEIDALGTAFEHFFSAVFRGGLGQYFTRRELVRFVCSALRIRDTDIVLDPAAGSGGFLLEALMQVWHYLDDSYAGQPEGERRKIDFALHSLFGIEIHSTLSRVCKTNLLIHKDGHTNVEGERSCLDSHFSLPSLRADGTVFSVVVGNPPFGDDVKEGDRDRLGDASLQDFELSRGLRQVSSELVIVERALQFLVPGGRLGMVVPDGALNNSGEQSQCPAFRRFLLRNSRIEMIVSLPDHAFRKAGAQNKTSLLFLRKYTNEEKAAFDGAYRNALDQSSGGERPTTEQEKAAIAHALGVISYHVFLAEVEDIGYTPAGAASGRNELYSLDDRIRPDYADQGTVLGQFMQFLADPFSYGSHERPSCHAVPVVDVLRAHPSLRMDPKFHLFQLEQMTDVPGHMTEFRLGDLLLARDEEVEPTSLPDQEFVTLTLSQDGSISAREPGKGNSPPSWHGAYFSDGSRWFRARADDLIISQIDLWKGCVSVVPAEFDGAIVTQEFPLYEVDTERLDPRYLALLLRSRYFMRAIRAITTGHSNRRRTQPEDFENLKVFLPEVSIQQAIAAHVESVRNQVANAEKGFRSAVEQVEGVLLGHVDPSEFLRSVAASAR